MRTQRLTSLLLFSALPFALHAGPTDDRKIEEAAKATYNYRTVLEDNVKVKAKDGRVTLTGTVEDQDSKDLAAETVRNLPGVKSVRNEIKIASTEPTGSDGWIAFKIRSSLLVKANVSVASTEVEVDDGVVTLSGTAENTAQKDLTEIYVREIEGVKSVTNNIVIEPNTANRVASRDGGSTGSIGGTTRTTTEREGMTARNAEGRDGTMSRNSKDREGGNAPIIVTNDTRTPGQGDRDTTTARNRDREGMTNRDGLNTRDHRAQRNESANQANRSDRETIDDASITAQVEVAINRHQSTKRLDARVTTTEGVVEITGNASSEAEKSLVSKLAQDTRGVRSVNNDMTVTQR